MVKGRGLPCRRTERTTRRSFLRSGAGASALLLSRPVLKAAAVVASEPRVLLKNGLVVDGTGKRGFAGNVLIKGATIEDVSQAAINIDCPAVDCSGKVIAPGFIDAHSHMDWVLPLPGHDDLRSPFTAQGCTTFVAGNCGWAVAGFRKASPYKQRFNPGIFPEFEIPWDSMAQYFDHIRKAGMSHNLFTSAGHGTARASMRWDDPSPLNEAEMRELLTLLEEAMDQGAQGVSLGLQYTPGIFATPDELKQIAQLVKKKDKLLSVHARAYTAVAPGYETIPGGTPHNVLAIKEMIDLARETGVRVQFSHLIFVGKLTQKTWPQAFETLDKAIAEGIDIAIDSYPYHCGTTGLTVVQPKWFRENLPANYRDPKALKKLEFELASMSAVLGFGYEDVQITHAGHPDLNQYNGLFLPEIARQMEKRPFEAAMVFAEKAGGRGAWVLLHNYSTLEIVEALMKHPACMFMTDAVPAKWLRNPAAYGSFPLFLQYARDRKVISLEEAVRKMTGLTAHRFRIKDRGVLRKGLAADITVFDWNSVKDNTTLKDYDRPPTGIEAVFINGKQVLKDGKVDASVKAGVVI
jgi:N-acyl-D-amino-acid deacylase